jgi:hypothetical protein
MVITKLEQNDDGTYTAVYEWVIHRFLLDDGRTIDVHAPYDDSVLREAVRKHTNAKSINGVAHVKPEPVVTPAKRVPAKKVGQRRAG